MSKYLRLAFSTGKLYEKSTTPQEGFEEYSWDAIGDIPAGKAYRKEHQKLTGELVGARLNKANFRGRDVWQFQFSLKVDNEYYNIQTDVLSKNGGFDQYLENFVRYTPNLQKGQTYEVSTYSFDPNNDGKIKRGFTFKHNGNKVEKALGYKSDKNPDGEIPPLKVKETKLKKVYDSSDRTDFLFETLDNWVNTNFPQEQQQASPSSQAQVKATNKQANEPKADFEEDDMGLPF